jgi:hypothetical protein
MPGNTKNTAPACRKEQSTLLFLSALYTGARTSSLEAYFSRKEGSHKNSITLIPFQYLLFL